MFFWCQAEKIAIKLLERRPLILSSAKASSLYSYTNYNTNNAYENEFKNVDKFLEFVILLCLVCYVWIYYLL